MKKKFTFIILFCFFCSKTFSQTADDIINKHIEAIGGREKINSLKTYRITGRQENGEVKNPFIVIIKKPLCVRMEMTIQNMTMIQACNEEMGWMLDPFEGKKDPEKLTEEDVKGLRDATEIIEPAFINYKEKGNTVELIGKEDMEGTEVYKLKVSKKNGDVDYFFMDASSYLVLKQRMKRTYEGKEDISDQIFGEFKKVDGVMFPFFMENKGVDDGEEWSEKSVLEKIELNIAVDDSIFKMPKTK